MQIYLIFFLEGHYFLDIQYTVCPRSIVTHNYIVSDHKKMGPTSWAHSITMKLDNTSWTQVHCIVKKIKISEICGFPNPGAYICG